MPPAFSALLLIACSSAAQARGPSIETFVSPVDGTNQPYGLYVPTINAGQRYPLVVSLHARASNHRVNLRQVFGRPPMFPERELESRASFVVPDVDFFVASPLARGSMGYTGIAERDVYDMIEEIRRKYPIDENAVYLTGIDMGGAGALWLAATRPHIWAAVAVVAPEPLEFTDRLVSLSALPVRIYQGTADPVIKVAGTRDLRDRLRSAGVTVEYTEFPNVRHNAWDPAYRGLAVFEWFRKHRRLPEPERVRFATREYKYNSAYWVEIDRMTPGDLATVEATVGDRIEVRTSNIDSFTVRLAERPPTFTIDGAALRAPAGVVSFTKGSTGWIIKRTEPEPNEKGPGAEGPAWDVVSSRHLYIYGTLDNPSVAEVEQRQAVAERAVRWSTPRSPLNTRFRVVADRDLTNADSQTANLVLFGNSRTNSLIARYAGRLPMDLHAGAADYGLVYLVPENGRYLLINSGLPWWTRADQARRAGLSSVPAPYEVLETMGDFLLFRGGLENVVVEGRFQRDWSLPPAALKLIQASGAVDVRVSKEVRKAAPAKSRRKPAPRSRRGGVPSKR